MDKSDYNIYLDVQTQRLIAERKREEDNHHQRVNVLFGVFFAVVFGNLVSYFIISFLK
jgi:hypothetical protein